MIMRTKIVTIGFWPLSKIVFTLLLCFVASIGFAENEFDNNYKYTKKRTIDANFNAGEDYTLNLSGKYSDYEISTWNENHISFHVEIVVKSNKEEKAEELLYQIDIDFENSLSSKSSAKPIETTKHSSNVKTSFDNGQNPIVTILVLIIIPPYFLLIFLYIEFNVCN